MISKIRVYTIVVLLSLIGSSCTSGQNEVPDTALFRIAKTESDLNPDSEYIVVLGDIQEYTANPTFYPYLSSTMWWIKGEWDLGKNIQAVLQVGDLTWANKKEQYEVFYKYTLPVAKSVPFIACIGNHDYDTDKQGRILNRTSTLFSNYVSFDLTKKKLVECFENGRFENAIYEIKLHGTTFYVLTLEYGPRPEVLDWASDYIVQHKDTSFILLTHEYLSKGGVRISFGSSAEKQFGNSTTWSTPEQVWQKLIKGNNNILCVLCGHNSFSDYLFSENSYGRLVPQLLFNIQYQKNGGDGLIQLWEFPLDGDSVNVRIYNTYSQQWYGNGRYDYKFRYKY